MLPSQMRAVIQAVVTRLEGRATYAVVFGLILLIGILARCWEFGRLPPGLNIDEASIGIEAYDLYHFGIDRNGISYPIYFISWGSGQNALYGYALIPFVAALGLRPLAVRLPMLIAGILTLPLAHFIGVRIFGRHLALVSTLFLGISPWHIILSRWGLESNVLPFVFTLGFASLLKAIRRPGWLVFASLVLGLSLYAYGTAFAAVPIFMLLAFAALTRKGLVGPRELVPAVFAFALVAAPIGIMLLVNALGLPSIALGPVTIPHSPVQPRYTATTVFSMTDAPRSIAANLWIALRLLITQSDGIVYNVADPYGYFYRFTFPLALLGIVLLVMRIRSEQRIEDILLGAWIGSSFAIAIFQQMNINRFNLIFIPLLFCTLLSLQWLNARVPGTLLFTVVLLLIGFVAFTIHYHGDSYRRAIGQRMNTGILAAIGFARDVSQHPICISGKISMPYIYALFSERTNPADFLATVVYVDPLQPLRRVRAFGRYRFGSPNCTSAEPYTYVWRSGERPPNLGKRYEYRFFDNFVVYFPRP